MAYRIVARIEATETDGLSVYDWFRGERYSGDILDDLFSTREQADTAARCAYLGPDADGICVRWHIEEAA